MIPDSVLLLLAELAADPQDPGIIKACEFVLTFLHTGKRRILLRSEQKKCQV